MENGYPRGFAHVGVTVPDIDAAIDWYEDVLDWELVKEPTVVTGDDGYGGKRAVDLLGEFQEMKVAHLVTGNQIGFELFEFTETEGNSSPDPRQPGQFHFCVVDPDVEGLARRIEERGGDHYTDVWRLYEDEPKYELTYCTDPFGNIIEIYSHSHELMHGNAPP